jgi:hypothetical protein
VQAFLQFLLSPSSDRNVSHDRDKVFGCAKSIGLQRNRQPAPDRATILANISLVGGERGLFARENGAPACQIVREIVGIRDVLDRPGQHFGATEPHDVAHALIDLEISTVQANQSHADRGVFEHTAETRLTLQYRRR